MILTKELMECGRSSAGGYNRKQLAAIGVEWPPQKGWLKDLIGKEIESSSYQAFLHAANP